MSIIWNDINDFVYLRIVGKVNCCWTSSMNTLASCWNGSRRWSAGGASTGGGTGERNLGDAKAKAFSNSWLNKRKNILEFCSYVGNPSYYLKFSFLHSHNALSMWLLAENGLKRFVNPLRVRQGRRTTERTSSPFACWSEIDKIKNKS